MTTNNIAADLYDAQSIEEKFSILDNEVSAVGFDGVLYTFIPKLSRLTDFLQPVFQNSKSYSQIIKHYQENEFDKHDFTIRLIESGTLDIIDWWEEAKNISLTEQELQVNHTIQVKFGVSKGITFPTLSTDNGLAGVSVISFKEEYINKKIDPKILEYLKRCARIYHDHMMGHQDDRYKFILPILDSLTDKKKIVIKHLISGQVMKNIEDKGVTERYGEKLLLELRKSFGNISKNELIYLLGLLNISEYL